MMEWDLILSPYEKMLYTSIILFLTAMIFVFSCGDLEPEVVIRDMTQQEMENSLVGMCGDDYLVISAPTNRPSTIVMDGEVQFALVGALCIKCGDESIFTFDDGVTNTRISDWFVDMTGCEEDNER